MKQSESIKSLLEGLVKAQAEFTTLPKDKSGYGYKYTDLDTVISTVKPILAKYNIGFMQMLSTLEGNVKAITTRVFNSAGEWIEDTTPLPDVAMAKTNAAQNLGAAITYMKRYTLCAMLGISSDEDVDGNAQQNAPQARPQQAPQNKGPAGGPDTPEQKSLINTLLATKDANGKFVFSADEKKQVGRWRMERTAVQVIDYLEKQIAVRKGDKFPEDIPYDEKPLSPEEAAGADASFDFAG